MKKIICLIRKICGEERKEVFLVVGMLVGVLAIILGVIILVQENASMVSTSTSFGADYYTESYKAMAYTVRNIYYLYDLVSKGLGFLLIVFGFSDICYFGSNVASLAKNIEDTDERLFEDENSINVE